MGTARRARRPRRPHGARAARRRGVLPHGYHATLTTTPGPPSPGPGTLPPNTPKEALCTTQICPLSVASRATLRSLSTQVRCLT
nr:MAG TPA: hypothetical protein [Caudoviricetes sp.]